MTKLNQIIAVANGKKSQLEKTLTGVYQKLQKPELFLGIARTYNPTDEEGEKQPSERKYPQYTVNEAISEARSALNELIDVVATQDKANTQAKANVVVDGKVVLEDVPVTHLLFLEKQLTDINTFVSKIPVLDPAERWEFDAVSNFNKTEPSQTNRTVKKLRNHVKAEATDKHPAQVDVYTEDVKVGEWSTIKFSGALDAKTRNEFLSRVKKLSEAVKFAREESNSMQVESIEYGKRVLDFVFG